MFEIKVVVFLCLFIIRASILQAYIPEGYIGCFKDGHERILEGKFRFSITNSGDECIQYCKRDGYRFAGTEDGVDCYCGHNMRQKIPSDDCTRTCEGKSNEICGGYYAISVYDLSDTKRNDTRDVSTETIYISTSNTTQSSENSSGSSVILAPISLSVMVIFVVIILAVTLIIFKRRRQNTAYDGNYKWFIDKSGNMQYGISK